MWKLPVELTQTISNRRNLLLLCWQVHPIWDYNRHEKWKNLLNHEVSQEIVRGYFSLTKPISETSVEIPTWIIKHQQLKKYPRIGTKPLFPDVEIR